MVAQDQMSVVLHFHDGCLKLAVLVVIGVEAVLAVERVVIEGGNVGVVAVLDERVAVFESLDDFLQELFAVYVVAEKGVSATRRRDVARAAISAGKSVWLTLSPTPKMQLVICPQEIVVSMRVPLSLRSFQ